MTLDLALHKVLTNALPILLAITVHEAAHGYAAMRCGDDTAKRMGRLTLNPFKHIDLLGTILIPAISLILGGVLFGWAKPVPVNPWKLRNPKRDMFWVAAAGPASNLLMCLIWLLVYKVFAVSGAGTVQLILVEMAAAGKGVNMVLMILNLLPLPPLDGGRILISLLPNAQAEFVAKIEPYGLFIILGLAYLGYLSFIMNPLIHFVNYLLTLIF